MDYFWILVSHTVWLLLSCFVNGIPHPSECDSLRRNVQRADSNSRTLDPESHLTGQWLSQGCETRPGPIHLLRHYNFYPPHHPAPAPAPAPHPPHPTLKFKLRHYYYADTGCSQALYTLSIHGSYRVDKKSWAVPDASQMTYGFHKIAIAGYSQAIVDELQHIINESCSGHIFTTWSTHRQYTIFLSNLETDDLFSSRAHGDFTTAPPVRNKQDTCLMNVHRMFQDLDLLKIVHRPMNSFDPYDRVKLYLGDLNAPVEGRKTHVPTAFQVPLIKSSTIQGCDVCKTILKSSYRDPPTVSKIENLPLYLDGEWISGECETQPLGIFIKRSLFVTLNNFTYESSIYSDAACSSITMSVTYHGSFHVRQLRDLAPRTTTHKTTSGGEKNPEEVSIQNETREMKTTHKKTFGGEKNPGEVSRQNERSETVGKLPAKHDKKSLKETVHFNVLPMIEMFANTQEMLSQNSLMRQSRMKTNKGFVDKGYEVVQEDDGENDDQVDKTETVGRYDKILSDVGENQWSKIILDEQGSDQNDNYLAQNKLEESPSSLEDMETLEHPEGPDVENKDKLNVDKDIDIKNKRESLVGLYEEILNSKLDGEFTREIVDNLLTSTPRRRKRHNSKHGTRAHSKHKRGHNELHRRFPISDLQDPEKIRLPTKSWPEILPLAWSSGKPNLVLPKVKVNQMNTIDKKDLAQFFVRHINAENQLKSFHKGSEVEKRTYEDTEDIKQEPLVKSKPNQLEIPLNEEDTKIGETAPIDTPERILYWYGRPNLGQVPIVENIVGETDEFTIPIIPLQMDSPNAPSTNIRTSDGNQNENLINHHGKLLSTNNIPNIYEENDRATHQAVADLNEVSNLQTDEDVADLNEYLVEFDVVSADLKMYDYDLIENLKYDHNCDARFQLWGTIIGDTIPLRSSCLSLGIQLPHLELTLARLQVSKYNKLTLYLEEPDQSRPLSHVQESGQSRPLSHVQESGQSRPLSHFQDPLANHNRIVNFRTLPLHKCKLYADDFYMDPREDFDIVENDESPKVDGVKEANKVLDDDDEDEDEYSEPLLVVDGDYEESVADKCDGSRSNVVVIVCGFSVVALMSRLSFIS